jgi:hypothetical protein
MLINGVSEIDSEDWESNTDYSGYTTSSQQIIWFWEVVHQMSNEEKSRLLQFVTGTTKLPFEGFAGLMGSTGPRKFQIVRTKKARNYLPTAHMYAGRIFYNCFYFC